MMDYGWTQKQIDEEISAAVIQRIGLIRELDEYRESLNKPPTPHPFVAKGGP